MKKCFSVLLAIALLKITAFAQPLNNGNKIDRNFHLYILMGQSNMAGRGEITEDYKNENHPRVFMLDKNNQWVLARHPVHFDKSVAGVGPGLAFAIKMANENPNVRIGLIPCAVGGTPIAAWQPGAYDKATKTFPYDEAVTRIETAMKWGVVKGMLWHQGEADSPPNKASIYLKEFAVLVERIRSVTHNAHLPVVAGELGRYKELYQNLNEVLKKLPDTIRYSAVASSEGLVDKGDNTHFSSASAETLGKRFAEKMILLQSKSDTQKKKRRHISH